MSDRYDTVRPARIISNIGKEWEKRNLRGSKDLIGRKDLIISFLLISGLGRKNKMNSNIASTVRKQN